MADSKQLDKQANTSVSNPTGKGGFGDNPENINRKGRPRKGMAWADIVVDIGEDELPSGVTKKEYIVSKVYELAGKGELGAVRLLWDSLVGSKQTIIGDMNIKGFMQGFINETDKQGNEGVPPKDD